MWVIRWILIVIMIVTVLGFALQNQDDIVNIRFLRWESGEIPIYIALFISFAAGMVTFLLISLISHLQALSDLRKEKKRSRNLEVDLQKAQEELKSLKGNIAEKQSSYDGEY